MPPPPPPSKSYLLVLDTDSEDEAEEDSYRIHQRPVVVAPNPTHNDTSTSSLIKASPPSDTRLVEQDSDKSDDCHQSDNQESIPSSSPTKLTKAQKRNKRRRKKKQQGFNGNSHTQAKRNVSFSTVSIRSYPRCFSVDAVPADGGWPLGMERGDCIGEEAAINIPLEDYETSKQEDLKQRWEHILQSNDKKICAEAVVKTMTQRPKGVPMAFETRQWDYKSGIKNPLFGILPEEQRQALFLESSSDGDDDKANQKSSSPSSPTTKRRPRSNSYSSHNGHCTGNNSPPSRRKTRSNSVGSYNTEQFNDTYNQVYVHHVRNELEQLRNDRSKSGATGCNCRKLTVYLPPKDGSGGKRSQHRRMKPSKITQELKKRNLYNPKASRETLEKTLHDAVAKEPCCRGDDCFCARNGIDCQADACSCWHDSHVHTSNKSGGYLSVDEIAKRCGNPLGMTAVDIDSIDNFRDKLLKETRGVCQPAVQ